MLKKVVNFFKQSAPILSSQQAYARWATSYSPAAHNLLMQVETASMKEVLPKMMGKMVLDMACGTGRWGRWAQENGAKQVVGFDNSLPMLQAGILSATAQVEMDHIPLRTASIDEIICGLAMGHLPQARLQVAIQEMGRVLRIGGSLTLSDFHPYLAWNGAQRTFTDEDGHVFAVEHYAHQIATYFAFAEAASLQLTEVREPTHPDPKTGKPTPFVLILRLTKA